MSLGTFRKGTVIYAGEPYVHALSGSWRGKRCDFCLDKPATLMKCSNCALMRYCNKECQKRDWKYHKLECKRLKSVSPNVPTESVRMLYRIFMRQKSEDNVTVKEKIGDRLRCFDDLVSHVDDVKVDKNRTDEFLQIFQVLKAYAGDSLQLPDAIMCLETFGRMLVNSFSICDSEMQSIGVGIYLGGSAFDHSCRPNAVAVFNKSKLVVRALQNIKKDEKIFISYIDQLDLRHDRKRQLKEQYYFDCHCPMCEDADVEESMKGVQCQTPNCPGIIAFTKGHSVMCRDLYDGKICDVTDICDSADAAALSSLYVIERVKNLQREKKFSDMLTATEKFMKSHGKALHPHHVRRVQITDLAFDACIYLKKWNEALKFGLANLEPYRLYYTSIHPNLGLLQMKLGKIYMHLEKPDKAFVHLKEANTILTVTHGSEHPLMLELGTLLLSCQSDLENNYRQLGGRAPDIEED